MSVGAAPEVLAVVAAGGGARFDVHVKPRSSRSRIEAVRGGALVVALHAPPVEGAANGELVALVAAALGVRPSAITIHRGARGRRKTLAVAELAPDVVRARLASYNEPE